MTLRKPVKRDLISASIVEVAIHICFLEAHETITLLYKIIQLETDFLSERTVPKFESTIVDIFGGSWMEVIDGFGFVGIEKVSF